MNTKEIKGLAIIENSLKKVTDSQLNRLNLMIANEIISREVKNEKS